MSACFVLSGSISSESVLRINTCVTACRIHATHCTRSCRPECYRPYLQTQATLQVQKVTGPSIAELDITLQTSSPLLFSLPSQSFGTKAMCYRLQKRENSP